MKLFNKLNKAKNAQGLPLNTIVIAILVIIVLLVIVVFFTSNVGKSGEQINQISGCTTQNGALTTIGYTQIHPESGKAEGDTTCNDGGSYVPIIPTGKDSDGKGIICCAVK